MSAWVEGRNLAKTYRTPAGDVPVLREVDLHVPRGAFCAITGPSGSGKTTLLNLLALLDTPTGGSLSLGGVAVHDAPETVRGAFRKEKIGMVFQAFHLLPHRSVRDNIRFRARYAGGDPEAWADRTEHLMQQFGLRDIADREARLLSGGEMQRVAIARALLVSPELLLADEPTGNLDRASAEVVLEALASVHRAGITVVLVTHNVALVQHATVHWECREGRLWPGG
ncbi:MAG TPA: ABC transporter ATP-binding protein [Kiritimatiellia bacterium]|nr:ABC transporter ATP-binding protein [Kiritimatiellia bacterium]HMO99713.1 ABC transporter ATP-binding protein [Kiritimatiellia bacterium]HMP97056.1 ABC transporter ATP-binding protein [Kiritimatiellia bacterium]